MGCSPRHRASNWIPAPRAPRPCGHPRHSYRLPRAHLQDPTPEPSLLAPRNRSQQLRAGPRRARWQPRVPRPCVAIVAPAFLGTHTVCAGPLCRARPRSRACRRHATAVSSCARAEHDRSNADRHARRRAGGTSTSLVLCTLHLAQCLCRPLCYHSLRRRIPRRQRRRRARRTRHCRCVERGADLVH